VNNFDLYSIKIILSFSGFIESSVMLVYYLFQHKSNNTAY